MNLMKKSKRIEKNITKSLLKKEDKEETKITKISTTDDESGVFHKGEHKKVFAKFNH